MRPSYITVADDGGGGGGGERKNIIGEGGVVGAAAVVCVQNMDRDCGQCSLSSLPVTCLI
jgi:hypothetical protein